MYTNRAGEWDDAARGRDVYDGGLFAARQPPPREARDRGYQKKQ